MAVRWARRVLGFGGPSKFVAGKLTTHGGVDIRGAMTGRGDVVFVSVRVAVCATAKLQQEFVG